MVAAFVKVTAEANAAWNADKSDAMLEVIAKESGMDLEGARASISTMTFPSVADQMSAKWLDGGVQTFMKGVADVFVEAGDIDAALDSYETRVNAAPLSAVQ